MLTEKINTLIVGSTGLSASLVAPSLLETAQVESPNLINIIIQIVVGIATLIKLFKKQKVK
jgi:hypothetical protein